MKGNAMDWMTFLNYAISAVETAALLGALIFLTRATKAGKNTPEKKNKVRLSVIFLVVFLVLTTLRRSYFGS